METNRNIDNIDVTIQDIACKYAKHDDLMSKKPQESVIVGVMYRDAKERLRTSYTFKECEGGCIYKEQELEDLSKIVNETVNVIYVQ